MTMDVAVVEQDLLPAAREIQEQVLRFVAEADADTLDEARKQAEALGLYAKRSKQLEQELYFRKVRMLTEAGIAILSWDMPDGEIQRGSGVMNHDWNTLGAALERGVLLDTINLFDDEMEKFSNSGAFALAVGLKIREGGWNYVPGKALGLPNPSVSWRRARIVAMELGMDLKSLPPDVARAKAQIVKGKKSAEAKKRHMEEIFRLAEERRNHLRKGALRKNLKSVNEDLAKAYGYLRQCEDALASVKDSGEVDSAMVRSIDVIYTHLYRAEDGFSMALRLGPSAPRQR